MHRNLVLIVFLFVGWSIIIPFTPSNASVESGFIENHGQWHTDVLFKTTLPEADIFILKNSIKYVFRNKEHRHDKAGESTAHARIDKDLPVMYAVEVKFSGAGNHPVITKHNPGKTVYNYFFGEDPNRWATGLQSYSKVKLGNLYEGIDLVLYKEQGRIKYDLIVAPGADPSMIALVYDGYGELYMDGEQLVVRTSLGEVREKQPVTFQKLGMQQESISCNFELNGNVVHFQLNDKYDLTRELVIDPELIFSTYSGSYDDNWGFTATYDDEGNLYSGGIVDGQNFPVTNGAYQRTHGGGAWDVAILKYDSTGSDLHYATFLGGAFSETPQSLVVNHAGELLVYGTTSSMDFPVTANAFQTIFRGGKPLDQIGYALPELVGGVPFINGSDMYIARLSQDGRQLLASTFVGGTENDGLSQTGWPLTKNYGDHFRGEIIVDEDDNVYVATVTSSLDFPIIGGFQPVFKGGPTDGVVVKLNSGLTNMIWSTYIGGSAYDAVHSIRLDLDRNVFVGGGSNSIDYPVTAGALKTSKPDHTDIDGVVSLINQDGSSLLRSTYVGTQAYDQVYLIDTDSARNIYLLGQTQGNYEVTANVYSNPGSGQFIHKIGHDLDTTYYSTVIGSGLGSPDFRPTAFLVNECENILLSGWGGILNSHTNAWGHSTGYVGGNTLHLPVTSNAFQTRTDGSDFYLMALLKDAKQVLYATFFGEYGGREHVDGGTSRFDKRGIVYQAVCSSCGGTNDFPTTPGAWSNNNNSNNCNNAAFKFDMASLIARFDTNTPEFDQPGIRKGCYPLDLVFINKSIGGEAYFWDFGNGYTTDQPDSIYVTYENPGIYEVVLTATDINTCVRESIARGIITVFDYSFDLMDPDSICYGDAIKLYAGGGVDYEWSPEEHLSNPGIAEPIATPDTTTIFTVNIKDQNGCEFEDSVDIYVMPRIIAEFDIDRVYDCKDAAVMQFINQSEMATDYLWDFGDGNTSDEFEPVYRYVSDTTIRTYRVRLTATASFCNEDKTMDITSVIPYIPNFISHNEDGKNDRFVIKTDQRVKLGIYNRWGKLVYKNDSYHNEWPEENILIGVYFYEITFSDEKTTCTGWVEVRR